MRIVLFNIHRHPNPDYPNMAAGLRDRGHEVILGLLDDAGNLSWHDGRRTIAVTKGPFVAGREGPIRVIAQRLQFLAFWQRLRRFLRDIAPDIVQMDPGVTLFPWLLPLAMPRTMRFIFDVKQINVGVNTTRAGRLKEWQLLRSWAFAARRTYDYALFDYHLAAEALLGPRWKQYAAVVPVGINPDFLAVQPAAVPPNAPVRFLFVGSLSPLRELELLFEAVALAAQQTTDFHVDLVGPDNAGGRYHRLVEEMNLSGVITLCPPVAHQAVAALMSSGYDVGIAYNPARPTWHYQPTIKVLEYRAAGLPIISTDVRSHREIVEQDVNGVLVPNTAAAWANALVRFATDRSFHDRCRGSARRMRRGTTIAEVAEMHEAVYRRLTGLETDNETATGLA